MRYLPLLFLALTLLRCANVIPPEGGPRDTIPPTLINSIPQQGERNYNQSRIILEFDEWIQLRNAKEEIVITPSVGKNTKFLFKKNQVQIIPELPLDSATTYSLSFRESIQDLNEGNPAEDLKLAFSTGPILDSLEIRGTIVSPLEGKRMEKISVAIYSQDTFNITKHIPSYISRSDKKGRFNITNLKPGKYYVYAWEDKNKNLKVETNTERFGTYPKEIILPNQKDSVEIPIIKIDSRPIKLNNYRNISNYSIIRLNKTPRSYSLKAIKQDSLISHLGETTSEIIAYPPLDPTDSTEVRLVATDSLTNRVDSTFYIKQTKSKAIKETFKVTAEIPKWTTSTKLFTSELRVNLPIKKINFDSISIRVDTIPVYKLNRDDVTYDSTYLRLRIKKNITLPDSVLNKEVNLFLSKAAFISIMKDSSDVSEHKVSVRQEKNLSTIIITSQIRKEGWIVQVVDEKYRVLDSQAHGKTITFKNLDPSNIQLRAYQDLNNNRQWDWNNPILLSPPEPIIFYRNEKGSTSIPLRANWTVELEWIF